MANISLQHVSKIYPAENSPEAFAVRDFNLDVKDREFVVFVGPSGCGKSTTLRMIAGLEEISEGDIYIGDRRVNDVQPKDRDIAMVFQNYALYPHMSVYDNMAFGLRLRKFSTAEIKKRVSEAAGILGIEKYLDRRPNALSGGERQRVAVGRAIVRQPKVFLFDEPLSNLDAKMRVQMRAEIIKLHQRLQATMIYVTHDQVEAMTMGDRIVVMKAGVIQQIDTPLALYRKPVNRFVAGFLGSPAMNFIPGTLKESAGLLVFNEAPPGVIELTVTSRPELLPFVGREIVAGVRPEDVVVVRGEEPAMLQLYVDIVEQMGAEANIHLNSRAHILLCRTSPAADGIKAGDKIGCEIAPGKVHLFDPETTCRIVGGSKSS